MTDLLYTDYFVTLVCPLAQFEEIENGKDCRLAPKSTSPHAKPFASLSFCYSDRSCQAQLTSNTDNIGHLFVTVFEHPSFL